MTQHGNMSIKTHLWYGIER